MSTPSPSPVSILPSLSFLYTDLADIFSKKQAESFPPHIPSDYAIDLLPGTTLFQGRVYPLSLSKMEAMSAYIRENLDKGFIGKSPSLAGVEFFFVEKKDVSF